MLESIAKQQGDIKSRVEGRSVTLQRPAMVKPPNTTSVLKENLVKIIRTFPTDLEFEPMVKDEPVLLNKLPEELLVLIISNLDPTSVERFATLSRKARLVCLDAGIWRRVFPFKLHVVL
jgi:F-box protein 9